MSDDERRRHADAIRHLRDWVTENAGEPVAPVSVDVVRDALAGLTRIDGGTDGLDGAIVGPGSGLAGVIVDATSAVLPDTLTVSTIDDVERTLVAFLAGGRVNLSDRRVRVLFALEPDALAAWVTELAAVLDRMGRSPSDRHRNYVSEAAERIEARADELDLDL